MRRTWLYALLAFAAVASSGCHRGMVRLQSAPGSKDYVWRTPIVRETFQASWGNQLYSIPRPVGYARGRQETSGGFVLNARLRWNDAIRSLGYHFDSLVELHNSGGITLFEFDQRKAQLYGAVTALSEDRQALDAALEACAKAEKDLAAAPSPEEAAPIEQTLKKARSDADAAIQRAAQRVKDLGAREADTQVLTEAAVALAAVPA